MKYGRFVPFLFAGLAHLATADDDDDQCPDVNGVMTRLHHVGSTEGNYFCEDRMSVGAVANGIEVWADKHHVKAIQVSWSDGSKTELYGRNNVDDDKSHHKEVTWDPSNDKITDLTLFGDGRAKASGRIIVKWLSGQELDVGKNTDGQDQYIEDVGSGILLSMNGRVDDGDDHDYIRALGFRFLAAEIESVEVTDMKFKDTIESLNAKREGIKRKDIDKLTYPNPGKINDTVHFGNEIAKTEHQTFSHASTNTLGITEKIEVKAEIPEIVSVTASHELSYQYSSTDTKTQGNDETHTLRFLADQVVPANTTALCTAFSEYGEYNGDYTSRVTMKLKGGGEFSFDEEGTMSNVRWSEAWVQCDIKDEILTVPDNEKRRAIRQPIKITSPSKVVTSFQA